MAESTEDTVQATGGNSIAAGLLLGGGIAGGSEQRLAGGGQGQAQQRQAQGAGQRSEARVHEDDPSVGSWETALFSQRSPCLDA